jgi:hypothetical protein
MQQLIRSLQNESFRVLAVILIAHAKRHVLVAPKHVKFVARGRLANAKPNTVGSKGNGQIKQ